MWDKIQSWNPENYYADCCTTIPIAFFEAIQTEANVTNIDSKFLFFFLPPENLEHVTPHLQILCVMQLITAP